MPQIHSFCVTTTSLVSKDEKQLIVLQYECSVPGHLTMRVLRAGKPVIGDVPVALGSGCCTTRLLLPLQEESFDATWQLYDDTGALIAQAESPWKKPRQWTIYAMISSHTDIGLHNSQYIQRANSVRFVDGAAALCDETDERDPNDRYRYTMEGTWFWNNYGMDKGRLQAQRIVHDYIKPGKIGLCSGIAGNHIQTYGLEEMCRSTYERRLLREDWDVESKTLSMIDNNGMPMSMIQPFANAGYENIIFAPNQWNPLPSTVWQYDKRRIGYTHNPDAAGGGSRVDVRYESHLPMVFDWVNESGEKLTVWASTQYDFGGSRFGFYCRQEQQHAHPATEDDMWQQLELLEKRYPFDLWLFACYYDDQEPELFLTNHIKSWNEKWQWPKLRTLGDPDEPFRLLKECFPNDIPVLKGDITGGWYQHPLTVPELMCQKFEADRLLPNAETWSSVAGILDENYRYPATDFRRAWDSLLFNDEHSYGTSGYQGCRVYETWLQHRDWIEKATQTARTELENALFSIAAKVPAEKPSMLLFNTTARERTEYAMTEDGERYALVKVPPLGYKAVAWEEFLPLQRTWENPAGAPSVENQYYKVIFRDNGAICSIFDKALGKELLDLSNEYGANELVYTRDNHKIFLTPEKAKFQVIRDSTGIRVGCQTQIPELGAEILQTVTLPNSEKRIDIDNDLRHVKDMFNRKRYYRYLYYAFPFQVQNSRRLCHLNGTVAEYGKDVTGHGTDVYMSTSEWCCCENDAFGVALLMKDSHVTEFDHIHPDKTDFGNPGIGSQIFSYIANDWLQMHTPGGSHLNYRFRYSITSYEGTYKAAGIDKMAERFVNPFFSVPIGKQEGTLPKDSHSFIALDTDLRLLCLKRADDGQGIIARLYGEGEVKFAHGLQSEPNTVDERPCAAAPGKGFQTYRLGRSSIRIPERAPADVQALEGAPAPIGSVYTGLVTKPRAAAGEHQGHLYLLWGASMEPDFSHYKLYRSEMPGFEPNEETFLADIQPEEYRVGRYEDTGLKVHTPYYYRVCAVNDRGICGPMSEEFSGYTRELLQEDEV